MMMQILGLTGSIAMGKTTAAEGFRSFGVPVFDADQTVHKLMGAGGAAFAAAAELFPRAVRGDTIDRAVLSDIVFDDEAALERLERIVHPLVRVYEDAFLERARTEGYSLVVLEIPLLFETDGAARCDAVAVVSAPADVQEQRILGRPGMTQKKLGAIRARQLPDEEKRKRADFVIDTSKAKDENLRVIENIVTVMDARARMGD